jgi:hypothetical protein
MSVVNFFCLSYGIFVTEILLAQLQHKHETFVASHTYTVVNLLNRIQNDEVSDTTGDE